MHQGCLFYRGLTVIASCDFLQLSFVMGRAAFQPPKNNDYNIVGLWVQLFKTYRFTEIVRQNSDSEFAGLLNRIREESHTNDHVREIKSLANTDTSPWLNGFVKVYLKLVSAIFYQILFFHQMIAPQKL